MPANARSEQSSQLDQAVAKIKTLKLAALRAEWRRIFNSEPPHAMPEDILALAIVYRLQEQVSGGLTRSTARLLKSLLTPGAAPPRRMKIGSVVVREHRGVLHEVFVVPGGYCWQGKNYSSLSTIAKEITGVSWNGPRFFGLRQKRVPHAGASPTEKKARRAPRTEVEKQARQSSVSTQSGEDSP